ncbi:hypothetical protein PSTG_08423 [Puccinia striiformis f. sp. tritici PST-78]|uniref:GCM domain-containing protein n=2 Tax=Puccinia striiformis f. sp. tritici TaxID=168172 RepID=A0A0L0VGC6_9BASI|nr:hypothetical protein PSTG_08423 [Puccinia striiformis f. sp. tritici PST-78]
MAPHFKKVTSPELYHPDYPDSDNAILEDGDDDGFEDVSDDDEECSATSKPKKTGTKTSPPKSGKEWFLPDSDQDYTNFANHGSNFNKEGYPLYLNRDTTFVQLPIKLYKFFGKFGYSKRSAWTGCPPTGKEGQARLAGGPKCCKGLAGQCEGNVDQIHCRNTRCRVDLHIASGWSLLRHTGVHNHPWPTSKKPCKILNKLFKAQVKKNPKAGAFELKLGKPTNSEEPFESVTSIHPAFQNKDRVAYYRWKTLIELNLVPDKLGRGVGKLNHSGEAKSIELFRLACMDLLELEVPDGQSHEQKVDYIRRRWPKVKKWLDWWTTADLEAQLFQSCRPRLEDSPETAYNQLPETTNAQESMHRLYYMISEGKQCLLVGMVDLFAFVSSLEDNWKSVMNGVPINYGSHKTNDVGLSMGLVKKRKQQTQAWIDGRPPDTTDTLLDGPGESTQPKKLGRPPNSASFNKNQFSTYVSYCRNTTNILLTNRCWLSASLESLYALFSPLWVRCISGFGKDLFTYIVEHFNSRSTYELTYQGTIRSSMTRAQTKMVNWANELYPGPFKPGDYASADFFLEISLDPKLHKSPWYKELFLVKEHQTFTCEAFPDGLQSHPHWADQTYHVLLVTPQMFSYNHIPHFLTTTPYSNVKRLLDEWQQSGLLGISGMVCKQCTVPQPSPKPKKKSKLKQVGSSIDMVLDYSQPASAHYIIDRTAKLKVIQRRKKGSCLDKQSLGLKELWMLDWQAVAMSQLVKPLE